MTPGLQGREGVACRGSARLRLLARPIHPIQVQWGMGAESGGITEWGIVFDSKTNTGTQEPVERLRFYSYRRAGRRLSTLGSRSLHRREAEGKWEPVGSVTSAWTVIHCPAPEQL